MNNKVKKITLLASIIGLFLFGVAYTLPSNNNTETTAKKETGAVGIVNVSSQKFNELIENGDGIILDVRTKRETDRGHIEGASFLDISRPGFEQNMKLIQKDKEIYVYCQSGARSYKAAQILAQNGYSPVYNLNGGLLKWNQAGFKMTRSTAANPATSKEMSISEFDQILDTDQKVLVEFKTTWCAPCKKMEPVMANLKKEFENKARIIQIDATSNMSLYKQYKVSGVPEFIVFENKKVVWRHTGMVEEKVLREKL